VKWRLAIITEIIAPYRIPVFNALAARDDIDLHVIFLSETDPSLRQWPVYKNEIQFSYEVLPAWRQRVGKYSLLVNSGIGAALHRCRPMAILCGGYNYLASWQAAWWAKSHKIPILLWSESTANDARLGLPIVEFAKFRFTRLCKAFVAAGKSSQDYLIGMGAPAERVFVAPDAVDVKFYAGLAWEARRRAPEVRIRHGLPSRYFLHVGRLVPEKGVFDLLAAYAALEEGERSKIGLVFVGDGVSSSLLAERATLISPGCVRFCGFVRREQLAELYALADALVFPTHSDPWGLVVNEAMACGLPVIATEVAGCVTDLVENGWNGLIVPAGKVRALMIAMRTLLSSPTSAAKMGARSFLRIQAYTPEACAEGLARAVRFACEGNE
jgi:glycosyltransferase involved in cell wall biosynthesis